MKNDYQIAVVEKAGYGFSDISDIDRDIDTILFETRESLNKAGIKNNRYILNRIFLINSHIILYKGVNIGNSI